MRKEVCWQDLFGKQVKKSTISLRHNGKIHKSDVICILITKHKKMFADECWAIAISLLSEMLSYRLEASKK